MDKKEIEITVDKNNKVDLHDFIEMKIKYDVEYQKKDKEIERLKEEFEKEKYLVDKYTRQLTDEYKNTEYQCKEKERLNNIIKEVREYCNNDSNFEIMTDFDTFENHNIIGKDILEILDIKEEKEWRN